MNPEDEFDEAFEGFGEEPTTQPADPPTEDNKENNDANEDIPTGDNAGDTPTIDEEESATVPSDSEEDKGEEAPSEPGAGSEVPKGADEQPEAPQPLTKEDLEATVKNLLTTERNSVKEIETATNEVLEAYYPDGLSNTLVDETTGKELRTPQDVVDASGGQMSIEEASQWLMNEQFKLDQQIKDIRDNASKIAETTMSFKRDAVNAVEKYEPLFKKFPALQQKVFDRLMKQVKADNDKGVILSAPDVMEFYDDYLEPYQLAFEHSQQQPATNPVAPPAPEPPKPTAEDRMDISGDGGSTPVNDPNDFAQQVTKELSKGL